ncbi:MAG: PEGA domain-containing protein, partial [Gemmatimonadales bacterium]
ARDDLPGPVIDLVARALAKAPAMRFDDTSAMVTAIEAVPTVAAGDDTRRVLGVLAQGGRATMVSWRPLPPLPDVPTEALTRLRGRAPRLLWVLPVAAAVGVIALGLGASGLWRRRADGGGVPVAPDTATALRIDSGATRLPPGTPPATRTAARRSPETPVAMGKLRLRTVPADAEILVDGRPIAIGSLFNHPVSAGVRRVAVRVPGYITFDTTVTVAADSTVNLQTVTLRTVGGPE